MKRWTRKLLAGLLSFGMLLQAASPLSALAADGVGADTAELIVILKQGDTGKEITAYVGKDTTSIDLGGNYKPTVAYGVDGYIITGPMGMYHSASGNGQGYSDEVTIKGVNGHTPSLKQDGQVNGDLTVENVDSFTKIGSVNGTEKINCTGDVELETESNVSYGLNVETQGSVTVTATGKADTLAGNTEINCDGPVNIKNTSTGLIICVGNLVVNTSSDVTISGNCESLTKYSSVADIKAKSLTMQNDDGSIGNVKFTRTDTTSAYRVAVGESESSNTQTALTDTTYSEMVNAKYLNIQPGTPENTDPDDKVTNYGITVTIGNNSPIKVTSENCGHILDDSNDKLVYDPNTHTLTGKGSFGGMKVEITSDDQVDVVLSNANGAVVNGSLTVTGAQDVKVTGVSSSALIDGETTITCAGDILMENTGTGNVIGTDDGTDLAVNSARSVTIKNVGTAGNRSYAIFGRADIICSGNVEIVSSNGRAIWDPVVISGAKNVNITAHGRAIWDSRGGEGSSIHCSGKVKITSETAAALYEGDLKITGATDVTISGNRDDGATIGGNVTITCSGPVVLENTGSGKAVSGELKYTPDPSTKPYEIKAGTDAADAASKEPVATKEEGGTFFDTVAASYISIAAVGTSTDVPGDDDFTGDDSGAGGAVAAVLVGGAAVWGGYEIATRVILHNILPEGAAIPANRGQLALLVWNNAGRPAPVNEPVFVDMDDADMAKAAQWCVEQGIMEAKTAETFKPEGWMPKFKVIEVWNKAFPKQ